MYPKEIKVNGPNNTEIIGRPSGTNQFGQVYEITTSQGQTLVKSQYDGNFYIKK